MRSILKFKRKNSSFKYTDCHSKWQSENGVHYVHYPFMIYRDNFSKNYKLTHMSSGALICNTSYLFSAKYIATRLLPVPHFLLPSKELVNHMSVSQRRYCTDVIERYREVGSKDLLETLDKKCPFSI